MSRTMLWTGAGLVLLGAFVLLKFVLPADVGGGLHAAPAIFSVAVASLSIAAGAALVGIGLGRWKRPRPSPHDGSPEV